MMAAQGHAKWRPITVNYQPSPGQLIFHKDRDTVRERAVLAGTAGGKTYACAFEALDITLRERGAVGVIAAPDFPQLEVSVYPTFERLLGRKLVDLEPYATFNQSKKRVDWWNGWTWRFASMDDPKSVEGIPDAAFVWLNEARLVRDFDGDDGPWANLTRRLRGEDDRVRRAWLDTHSPTTGIMRAFKPQSSETYAVGGGEVEVTRCEGSGRGLYRWGLADAKAWGTVNQADADVLLKRYHGSSAARILEGRHARSEGLVYGDFTDSHLQTRPPNLKPEAIAGGLDWGWDVTALQVVEWTGSKLWSSQEWQAEHASLKDIAKAIRAAYQVAGREFTVWGGPDRPDSARELSDLGVDCRPAPPSRVMDGVGILQSALQQTEWAVAPHLKWLRQDIDNYEFDKDRGEPAKNIYDAHHADAVRYAVIGEGRGMRRLEGGITW